jgi:hypothetical protein
MEWMFGGDKKIGKFGINAFVGGNKMTNEREDIGVNGSVFNVPFFESVNNTSSQSISYGYNKYGINSLFSSAELSYGGYL